MSLKWIEGSEIRNTEAIKKKKAKKKKQAEVGKRMRKDSGTKKRR